MPLDPNVSLAVDIAESPGAYAFLLGSGVSRDAGVPTGREVFLQTIGALYRLETETTETPKPDTLSQWLAETGRADLDYSSLLEKAMLPELTRILYPFCTCRSHKLVPRFWGGFELIEGEGKSAYV
jgi:hypothetical protein